ncbi:aminotransferase class V-fold PLP-dependent enzyme [Rhodospirillaceae bacterium SYSU D60014]|uniref:aminotransferase class V-fold PLP-dependent enzyme n=1 Tax=Virgifigura deserti TaxID=2268457 RepID=UPI000E67065A
MIDLDRARRDTPATATLLHFNNAGASLMPQPVLAAQIAHLQREATIGAYEAAEAARDAIDHTYASIARLLNCRFDEIALVENATVGWSMAFYGLKLGPGDRILTARAEYASNFIAFLQVAARTGAVVEAVPNDESGQLSIEALTSMIDDRVKLIAITHVPTNSGLVNPAEAVGRVARAHNIPFLLDACQSAGQLALDVEALGCDMLSATGRKYLRGPRGTGFLYVRRAILDRLEPPFLDLHAARWVAADRYEMRPDARRFENWENNVAGLIGLGTAVAYALDWGLPAIEARVTALAATLRDRLGRIAGISVTDIGERRCGIVSFTVATKTAEEMARLLRARRINVSVSGPGSTLLDATARRLPDLVRASVHYYNSEEEVERFATAVAELA